MRLSEWRAAAPNREAMSAKVLAIVQPALTALGADADPQSWVAWGEDPHIRYVVLVPTASGLIWCAVRVNVPGEGPRASAKLVRWNRVQFGELALETQGSHRVISFQVEGTVIRGADAEADRIGQFAHSLLAVADGRSLPEPASRRGPGSSTGAGRSRTTPAKRAAPGAKAEPRRRAGTTPRKTS
jgi:hypothetical protein